MICVGVMPPLVGRLAGWAGGGRISRWKSCIGEVIAVMRCWGVRAGNGFAAGLVVSGVVRLVLLWRTGVRVAQLHMHICILRSFKPFTAFTTMS